MMHVETTIASAAEGPSGAEWEALENLFYIVTLLYIVGHFCDLLYSDLFCARPFWPLSETRSWPRMAAFMLIGRD